MKFNKHQHSPEAFQALTDNHGVLTVTIENTSHSPHHTYISAHASMESAPMLSTTLDAGLIFPGETNSFLVNKPLMAQWPDYEGAPVAKLIFSNVAISLATVGTVYSVNYPLEYEAGYRFPKMHDFNYKITDKVENVLSLDDID